MNAKFKSCLEAYKNDRSPDNQHAIEQVYISEFKDRKEIQKEILNLVKYDVIDIDKDKAIPWEEFFKFDDLFHIEILSVLNQKEAEDFLEQYQKGNITSENAEKRLYPVVYSYVINSMGLHALGDKIYHTWKSILDTESELVNILESLKEALPPCHEERYTTKNDNGKIIQVLEISFPLKGRLNGKLLSQEEQEEVEYSSTFKSAMKMYEEKINKYCNSIAYPACYKSKIEFTQTSFTFTLYMQKQMDLQKLKSYVCDFIFLTKRAEERTIPVLIEDKLYYFELDINKDNDFKEVSEIK